ncbi:MAG: hypothetical protein V3S94_04140, partial [Gammaproteobacteria bacterium]
ANTGGDRLIDWVGEFNSYITPFAPFGMFTVSRTLQPQLMQFLYDLSESDGADPTRFLDTGSGEFRNGEPEGELGLVLQKDQDWHDQTGAPDDPQAGNIPGGKRDVLKSATFNNGKSDGFVADSGTWTVEGGRFQVAPESLGGDAVSVYYLDEMLPSYFEILATINADKPTGGFKSNTYLIFDYQSSTDFKFAGINISLDKIQMGHRTADGWIVDVQTNAKLRPGRDYNVLLAINGLTATLVVNNADIFTYVFQPRTDQDGFAYGLNAGMIGIGVNNSSGSIDNVKVQVLPPEITFQSADEFASDQGLFTGASVGTVTLAGGQLELAPDAGESIAYQAADMLIDPGYLVRLSSTLKVASSGGFFFDHYGENDFKFAVISSETNQVLIGHSTNRGGWQVDAAVDMKFSANRDYELELTLQGGTISVVIDGQIVMGHAFNALVTDGAFGLLTVGGYTSFDSAGVGTNDPAFANTTETLALHALAAASSVDAANVLTGAALAPIVDEAIVRLGAAEDLDAATLAYLESIHFEIVDLPGLILANTDGETILIDRDAAGHGWFVDATPDDDNEFRRRLDNDALGATANSPAAGHIDLLTSVTHELGHVIGLDHVEGAGPDLMSASLALGLRLAPATDNGTADLAATATNGTSRVAASRASTQVFDEERDAFLSLHDALLLRRLEAGALDGIDDDEWILRGFGAEPGDDEGLSPDDQTGSDAADGEDALPAEWVFNGKQLDGLVVDWHKTFLGSLL